MNKGSVGRCAAHPGCGDHLGQRGHAGVGVTEQPCGQKQRIGTRERELGVSSRFK